MDGWVKLHRSLLEWEWYDDHNTKILFLHCLLKANYEEKKWHGNHIERGAFITSYSNLSKETGLTVKQVRTSISKLKKTGELGTKKGKQFTYVSICKYDTYQYDEDGKGKQMGRPRANLGQQHKKEKKEKKKEVEENLPHFICSKLWEEFKAMRNDIGKPLTTQRAINGIIKNLIKFESVMEGAGNTSLEQSINNCWRGVFPPKKGDIMVKPTFNPDKLKQINFMGEDVYYSDTTVYKMDGSKHPEFTIKNGMIEG